MMFDLHNPIDRVRFERKVAKCISAGGIVELTERRGRSRAQNAWLHLTIGYFASEFGLEADYVKEMYYKRAANAELYVRRREDRLCGLVEYTRSSSELTREEMSLSLDRWKEWCARVAEFVLPEPDEGEFLDWVEVESARSRTFL